MIEPGPWPPAGAKVHGDQARDCRWGAWAGSRPAVGGRESGGSGSPWPARPPAGRPGRRGRDAGPGRRSAAGCRAGRCPGGPGRGSGPGSRLAAPMHAAMTAPAGIDRVLHLDVLQREAGDGRLVRRHVAQQLVDGAAIERRDPGGAEPVSSGWVSRARMPPAMPLRVVSKPAPSSRVAMATSSPVVSWSPWSLGPHQQGEQVVTGAGPLLGHEGGEVLLVGHGGHVGPMEQVVGHHRLDGQGDLLAPGPALLVVLVGHAEQLADHGDRDEVGELGHQIGVVGIRRAGRAGRRRPAGRSPAAAR